MKIGKVEDVLLGLAAGDRIGGPTQMALCVAESLAERKAFEPQDILLRYLKWWTKSGFDTGPTAHDVFRLIASGMSARHACLEADRIAEGLTAGCNPAHRSVALALLDGLQDEHLATSAMKEAQLTHRHPLAGDTAAATVRVVRALVRGDSWAEALKFGRIGRSPAVNEAFSETKWDALSDSGYAPLALQAALWFLGRSSCLEEALERSAAFAGPGNYCAVLVGSIGGARWGAQGLSSAWYEHHPDLVGRVRKLSLALGST